MAYKKHNVTWNNMETFKPALWATHKIATTIDSKNRQAHKTA